MASAAPRDAHAYGQNTHRWVARQAVQYLVARFPGEYDDLLMFEDDIADGAEHEDDFIEDGDGDPTTMRVMRHFYRPTDGLGIEYGGFPRFPSSYVWGGLPNETNQWDYVDGIRAFAAGDETEAYFTIGHTIHLITDLTVPAHSHLDEHGPPDGDDYESYCGTRMSSEFVGTLKGPAPDAAWPNFETLQDAFQGTAEASYWRNMVPGHIDDEEGPSGAIAEMFPDLKIHWFYDEWYISGFGTLGSAFYEEPDSRGYYYFHKNHGVAAMRRASFDPSDPFSYDYSENTAEQSMAAAMADDLTPVAVLHSAAVLKMFVDEARKARKDDSSNDDPSDMMPGSEPAGCQSGGPAGVALPLLLALVALGWRRTRS
jgi:uncharacterized protein (TIGR03382 family)